MIEREAYLFFAFMPEHDKCMPNELFIYIDE